MSTRRARIKAVTSLPPRRKNNDNSDSNKSTTGSKNEVENVLKSPKTPRTLLKIQESLGRHSPKTKTVSPLKSPQGCNNDVINQPEHLTLPSTNKDLIKTPKTSEKVSVITSANKPLFISPNCVASPIKKPTPRSYVPETDMKTVDTPEKINESPRHQSKNSNSIGINNSEKTLTDPVNTEALDDYNVHSVPESIPEDWYGIIPLQLVTNAPKPIALLKNEIISENAEVLFDPIVPLPSPSKVRPKLRPVPRLNPLRRNSIQGSASESEDETRRALLNAPSTPVPARQRTESYTSIVTSLSLPKRDTTRIRNDSVCSSVSQVINQTPAPASPLKEKYFNKTRRQEMASRRMAHMRRRRDTAKSGALTMYDLIFYNPSTNPIVPDQDELLAKDANKKADSIPSSAPETEDNPDDPPEADAAPVPQIKLGANGEIILDEQSLVIKQSEKRRVSSSAVVEGSWSASGAGRYRRAARTADWPDAETVRFYRALAALGTDFMLMERLFPGRTRRDLKLKFKKEERVNPSQVDKALRTSSKWDATKLEQEFTAEREEAERRAQAEAERIKQMAKEERERNKLAKELRGRQSKAAKVMSTSILPDVDQGSGLTADDFIRRHLEAKAQQSAAKNKRKPKGPRAKNPELVPTEATTPNVSQYAKLTSMNKPQEEPGNTNHDMATLRKLDAIKAPEIPAPAVPSNIEVGSLVVLTVSDPKSPSKKMLQTYVAHGEGKLTPVALPPSLLNSVVSYMKKGTPKSTMSDASSPSSIISHDSRSTTPGVIIPSPAKRQRHSSYTITQL